MKKRKSFNQKNKKIMVSSIAASTLLILGITENNTVKAADLPPEVSEHLTTTSLPKAASNNHLTRSRQFMWGNTVPLEYDANNGTLTIGAPGEKYTINDPRMLSPVVPGVKHIVIAADLIKINGSAAGIFSQLVQLQDIQNLDRLDTSDVTNMSRMFFDDRNLAGVDVSHFNTAKVTDMNIMFGACEKITELDVSRFDTSNVTGDGLRHMFSNLSSVKKLDISNFKVDKVTNLNDMFFRCSSLEQVKLPQWNSEKIAALGGMFEWCEKLKEIDLSSFKNSTPTEMDQMFYGCKSLEKLDLSGFKMTSSTLRSDMLTDLPKLKWLKLGKNNVLDGSGLNTPVTWYNQGDDPSYLPANTHKWSSSELISNYNPNTDADTYATEEAVPKPLPSPVPPTDSTSQTPSIPITANPSNHVPSTNDMVKEIVLKHNAYLYDQDGKRANKVTLKFDSELAVHGKEKINGRTFYVLVDQGADKQKYYVVASNADATAQVLKHNAYVYNRYGKRIKHSKMLRNKQRIDTYGDPLTIRGHKYFIIARNRFIKANNVMPITVQSLTTSGMKVSANVNNLVEKQIMHNAYLYDEQGQRANKVILTTTSVVDVIGKKVLKGTNYYELSNGLDIVANNIDGTNMKLKHNAYVYSRYGNRLGKKVFKKNHLVRTYGSSVTIKKKKYYIVGQGTYMKVANFK